MNKIISNDFKITSIVARGYYIKYLIASLVKQFQGKNVLLWQDMDIYHSCKRLQLSYGVDLIGLLDEFIDDFDVLIVDKLRDSVNVAETITFLEQISKMEQMKNKQVIIIFSACVGRYEINIEDLHNLKYTIKTYSDNIYCFNRVAKDLLHDNKYQLQDLKTGEISYYKEKLNKINTSLEKIDE